MLKMVDGTGIIGVDMICPLGVSTPQPPNYDRVELEGAGMLVLPNSLDAPLERLELGGKTTQMSTRGVNLFDVSKVVPNNNVIRNGDGSIKVIADESNNGFAANTPNTLKDYCPLLIVGQTYTLSANTAATTKQIYLKESGTVWTYGQSVQITKEMLDSVVLFYSDVNKTSVISNIQIERGSTATAYEPYSSGKASPSQEYQQKIKNVGKWNEETQKYEVDVKITNAEQNWSKEQTPTLTSDRPLTKWDRLVEQGGQIGWLYKHKIIEDFSMLVKDTEPIYGNDGGKYFSVSLQNASLNYDRSKIYSEVGTHGKDNKIHYIPKPMMANVIIYVSDTDTIMTAKEHMHYKVIYETIESQFVPLPQSEQSAIRALKTYYPTTVITADGGELDPDIKVTYRKEI